MEKKEMKTCRNHIMFNAKLHWTQAVSQKKKKCNLFRCENKFEFGKYQIVPFTMDNNFKLLYTHFA